jgi:DNA-binding transcriptional regulator YhcF (GntR family)
MDAGWTAIPSVILDRQLALGLDAVDINILFHLAKYWWKADNHPYPSKGRIATCMGVDPSTIRRRIARMERDGLIHRRTRFHASGGQQTNQYIFDGLIKGATPFAIEALEDRTKKRAEKLERQGRKKPRLHVLEGGKKK